MAIDEALTRLSVSGEYFRERGLACTVSADQSNFVALVDAKVNLGHQNASAYANL
jgi:hypothetical protein